MSPAWNMNLAMVDLRRYGINKAYLRERAVEPAGRATGQRAAIR